MASQHRDRRDGRGRRNCVWWYDLTAGKRWWERGERGKRNCVRLCDLTKRERVTKMNSSFDKWVGEVCFDTWFMNNETSSLIFEL